jgi:hypothetical protein
VHNRVENNCSAISISIRKGFLGWTLYLRQPYAYKPYSLEIIVFPLYSVHTRKRRTVHSWDVDSERSWDDLICMRELTWDAKL